MELATVCSFQWFFKIDLLPAKPDNKANDKRSYTERRPAGLFRMKQLSLIRCWWAFPPQRDTPPLPGSSPLTVRIRKDKGVLLTHERVAQRSFLTLLLAQLLSGILKRGWSFCSCSSLRAIWPSELMLSGTCSILPGPIFMSKQLFDDCRLWTEAQLIY